jgi:hypothetical protein
MAVTFTTRQSYPSTTRLHANIQSSSAIVFSRCYVEDDAKDKSGSRNAEQAVFWEDIFTNMSGFTALNVEPEDAFEEEVDDTRELQLEEAFKLYNAALRLHSQGPGYYDEAFQAYLEVFRSDVFKDPEFASGYTQDQLDDNESGDVPPLASEDAALALLPTNVADPSANSVPQLMFLAHKNRGQFVLEFTKQQILTHPDDHSRVAFLWFDNCRKALQDFAEALERDDSDLDLWKKAAKVADVFSSQRIVRFCLESVLAGDDDAFDEGIDLSGLDEAYAAGELGDVIRNLGDDLSLSQAPEGQPKQPLVKALKRYNNPFPFLSTEAKPVISKAISDKLAVRGSSTYEMEIRSPSWLGVGQALLSTLIAVEHGTLNLALGGAVKICLPVVSEAISSEAPSQVGTEMAGSSLANQISRLPAPGRQISTDAMVESPEKDDISMSYADSGDGDPQASLNALPSEKVASSGTVAETSEITAVERTPALPNGSASMDLPTRKRSSTVAGHDDANETRSKSKRLRARESLVEGGQQDDEVIADNKQYFEDQLEIYRHADGWMLKITNELLKKAGVNSVGYYQDIRTAFEGTHEDFPEDGTAEKCQTSPTPLSDLRQALGSWSDEMNQALLYGHSSQDLGGNAGLTLFLQHSKLGGQHTTESTKPNAEIGLGPFVDLINKNWSSVHDTAVSWLCGLLCSGSPRSLSSYAGQAWSSELKQIVVKVMTTEDEQIYDFLKTRIHNAEITGQDATLGPEDVKHRRLFEFVQSLFELHLDIYSLITNPSSLVDLETRIRQRDCLTRWANLTSQCLPLYAAQSANELLTDALALRYVWASTLYATLADSTEQDHVMLCFKNLEDLMSKVGITITMPNNVAMPEISTAAAQQEMSRLSTLEFFMSVFDNSQTEPLAIIERLEPILEPETSGIVADLAVEDAESDYESSQVQKLTAFLASGDVSLKLYLWRRLHNAYVTINYIPKTVSCNLRSIETIMSELESKRHQQTSDEPRILSTLKWIKDTDDLVAKLLSKVLQDSTTFECIDEIHLQSSISAVAKFSTLLHGFAMYEDSAKIGQVNFVNRSASFNRVFEKCKDKFREMEVRSWTLLYALLKEATLQLKEKFPDAADDLANYLRSVHNALGVRQYCRLSNKVFLKVVKKDLLATQTSQDYSADVYQVLYDLHGLKFDPGLGDADHGCPLENMDKKTATQMVEIIMPYVNRRSIKDILRSELKGTIEKIQTALGAIKLHPDLTYNKRQISHFLKSQINPKELYRCVKGIGNLSSKAIHSDSAKVASHGWYFLLGQIALTRFKSVKRINPTPTDDLDIAATFFRHDLEHDNEKWETWYRLAQIYDAKIEEDLVWNVSKINDHRPELATLQRNAIHAYTMAIATAWRTASDNLETAQKMQEMYADFAARLYASSREPLTMEAFQTNLNIRHYSGRLDQQMYTKPPYDPMPDHAVWNFAAYLLRRKFTTKAKPWTTWYTLGKCLWKVFCRDVPVRHGKTVTVEEVLNAFTWAIEALPPRKKDSRSDTAYVLEPHFKLASVVHKMVHGKAITPKEGVEWLQGTSYARKISLSEDETGPDWEEYILAVLKKLGDADKLNWHHRIIARAAHVNYDDDQDIKGALGAKHEFTQQIFTKTMTMQVWKPEHERAGRHYVYTSRYVSFFVTLLDKLNDRSNLESVLRRVRRKPTEFLEHQKLWEEIVTKYIRLLRRQGKIPEGQGNHMVDMAHEEFSRRATQLERWAHDPDTTSTLLDIVRDAVEMKKLNNSLMKGSMFDELIADSYSSMYASFVSQLPPEEAPTLPPAGGREVPATPGYDGAFDASGGQRWNAMLLNNIIGPAQADGPAGYPKPPVILTSNVPMGSSPVGLGLQQSMQSQVTFQNGKDALRVPMPNKTGRPKQITKRELIRRAEAAIVRPPPIKTPTLSKKPIIEISITPSRSGTADLSHVDRRDGRTDEIKDDAVASEMSSRRNSIHDSADDESELSDIDEDAGGSGHKPRSMFPGFAGMRKGSREGSSPIDEQDDGDVDMADGEEDGDDQDQDQGEDGSEDDGEEAVWHDAEEGTEDDGGKGKDISAREIPDSQDKAENPEN